MLISEIYHSKQGEGILTGTPSVFLRTSGCNLRCGFCDTPFASWNPEGDPMTLLQIGQSVSRLTSENSTNHVVITGGEPMIQKQIAQLTQQLHELGLHITIETAGTVFQNVHCDLMSISPKLANSTPLRERAGEWVDRHEQIRHNPDAISRLMNRFEYQLKFVVDSPTDFSEIESYLNDLSTYENDRVLLMPQGIRQDELESRRRWLEPYCLENNFRFSPRMHIEWYGNKRGT